MFEMFEHVRDVVGILSAYGEPVAQETDAAQTPPPAPTAPARALPPFILPAAVVGVVAGLVFVGVGRSSVLWMFVMLLATGLAVGLVVWKAPGHAGPGALWPVPAEAATIGALFGTPVAAALVISEAPAGRAMRGQLWDNVFAPLIAGVCGAMTTTLVAHPTFDVGLPPMGHHPRAKDLLAALVIASAAALLGMGAVYAFRRLRHPMLMLPADGVALGALGPGRPSDAVQVFPAVFIGTALGLCAHALVPAVHPAVGVATGVLGILLAITRQARVSLFTAAVLVASPSVLALLCIASLPAWLPVTGRAQMQLREDGTPVR